MPTYLALHEYTRKGAENLRDGPERLAEAKELATSMDCRVKDFFLTNGRYDVAVVVEAPDETTGKQLAMAVTSEGTVTTEFVRAFTEDEFTDIVTGLPE
jgi:uncharacterized protein with GYD domain